MAEQHSDIDRLLRQKLESLPEPDSQPAGWERLSASLDRPAVPPVADMTAADATVAAALNGLTPKLPAAGWDKLRERLDEHLGREVDVIVSHHLKKDAGRTSGWASLAARLELISHRRHLIGAWKVTEACLLASMLLLLLRFGPAPARLPARLAEDATTFPMPVAATIARESNALLATPPPLTETRTTARPKRPEGAAVLPSHSDTETDGTVDWGVSRPDRTVRRLAFPAVRLSVSPPTVSLPNKPATEQLLLPRYAAKWRATAPAPVLTLPVIDRSVPVRYYLNLFISPLEVNEVITPESSVANGDIVGRKELTHSISTGALLDISKGKDGIQLGAVYGVHAYTPTALLRSDCGRNEDCASGYNRFVYHSISFSFDYERSLIKRNDWRVATRGGMAMSVITQSEFPQTMEEEVQLEQALYSIPDPTRMPPRRARNNINPEQVLDPEAGWFEGGALFTNASFYLQTGFTVERMLTPRFSVYLSPSYGRVIYLRDTQGVGPYNDRIHRASLRFGSRFLLSGK